MGRHECTSHDPWDENRHGSWARHPDAVTLYTDEGGLSAGGDYDRMECPHCKHRFWVNLPN